MTCHCCGAEGAKFSAGGEALFCGRKCFAEWDRREEAEAAFGWMPPQDPPTPYRFPVDAIGRTRKAPIRNALKRLAARGIFLDAA